MSLLVYFVSNIFLGSITLMRPPIHQRYEFMLLPWGVRTGIASATMVMCLITQGAIDTFTVVLWTVIGYWLLVFLVLWRQYRVDKRLAAIYDGPIVSQHFLDKRRRKPKFNRKERLLYFLFGPRRDYWLVPTLSFEARVTRARWRRWVVSEHQARANRIQPDDVLGPPVIKGSGAGVVHPFHGPDDEGYEPDPDARV
jgi:hypothetical protein